jgi:hypothetical protein
MTNNQIEQFKVVCDETNNTKESLEQGYLKVDVFVPQYYYKLKFTVNKDGKIEYDK